MLYQREQEYNINNQPQGVCFQMTLVVLTILYLVVGSFISVLKSMSSALLFLVVSFLLTGILSVFVWWYTWSKSTQRGAQLSNNIRQNPTTENRNRASIRNNSDHLLPFVNGLENRLHYYLSTSSSLNDLSNNSSYANTALRLAQNERDFDDLDYESLLSLDNFVKKKGINSHQLRRLPIKHFHKNSEKNKDNEKIEKKETEKCMVCLEPFEEDDELITLTCFHDFHKSCISKWLELKAVCPICNQKISFEQNL
ncbi:ring/u-box superfamily protein [Anaeramoeba flamelloides]|uniref:Ring/u-box superfamily protein n=1 Tax=Anaeramoeba flamelloides TaxID=1746091 RepID=A0ABQ8YJC8_9EUKA|nr:ring/u-box superfamily protein [Anaeramoeba flamelloides]